MEKERFCILSDDDRRAVFNILAATLDISGLKLVFSKEKNDLVFLDNDKKERAITKSKWHSRCNTIANNFDYHARAIDKNVIPTDSHQYKPINTTRCMEVLDDIRADFYENAINLPIYDKFLERIKSIEWDGKSRLSTNPWILKHDQLGAGKHILKKCYTDLILLRLEKRFNQTDESYVLIDPIGGIGKSALSEKLCFEQDKQHKTLDDVLDYGPDKTAFYRELLVIELVEMIISGKSSGGHMKKIMTADTISGRKLQTNFDEIIKRTWIFVGTSNNKQCIPKDAIGRRFLPIELEKIDKNVFPGGVDEFVDWLDNNRDQLYAEAYNELKNNNYEPTYPSYRDFNHDYQKEYSIDGRVSEDVNVFNEKLDSIKKFDIRKYPVNAMVLHKIIDSRAYSKNAKVFRDSGWKDLHTNSGNVWMGPKCKLDSSNYKNYIITQDHIDGKITIPSLPNDNNDPDGGGSKIQSPPPNNKPPGLELDIKRIGPNDDFGDIENVIDEYGPPNDHFSITKRLSTTYNDIKGGVSRLVDKRSLISPGFVKEKYFNDLNNKYGAFSKDFIEAHKFLYYEIDDLSLKNQCKVIKDLQSRGIKISFFIWSGNKSLHVYMELDKPTTNLVLWKDLQLGLINLLNSDINCAKPSQLMAHPNSIHKNGNHTLCWELDSETNKLEDLMWLDNFNIKAPTPNYTKIKFDCDNKIKPPTQNEADDLISKYWYNLPSSTKGDSYTYDLLVSHAFICKAFCEYYGLSTYSLESAITTNNSYHVKKLLTIPMSSGKSQITDCAPFWKNYWEFYPNDRNDYYRSHSNNK